MNGNESATASTPGSTERERNRDKADKHKAKRKERKERDHAEREAAREAGSDGGNDEKKDESTTGPPKPNLDTSSPAPGSDGPLSPRTDSTGARTPTSRKQARNPWTLFIRLPNSTTETELRDFFGEAKNGVRARCCAVC